MPGAAAWTGVRMRRPGHDRSQVLSPSLELNLDTCVHPHLHIYHLSVNINTKCDHGDRFISVQLSRSDLKLISYSCLCSMCFGAKSEDYFGEIFRALFTRLELVWCNYSLCP